MTYTYDAAGNMTNENRGGVNTAYTYGRENRLTVETAPDGSKTTMTYAGDGLRRSKQTATELVTYVWDGSDYLGEYKS